MDLVDYRGDEQHFDEGRETFEARVQEADLGHRSTVLKLLGRLRYQQAEKRIMLAVLKDVVGCIERYYQTEPPCGRPAYQDPRQWTLSHDHTTVTGRFRLKISA